MKGKRYYDILVNGVNHIQGNFHSPVGKIVMHFYYDFTQRDKAIACNISTNAHSNAFINIHKAGKKTNAFLGPTIINISIK